MPVSRRCTWPTVALCLLTALSLSATAHQPEPNIPLGRPPLRPASPAAGAGQFTVEIEGAKQGKFKGEGTRESNKDKIVGVRFDYELHVPHDATTGAATGKRQHEPLVVTKEWGAASPQIFQAAATGETLKQIDLEFYKSGAGGENEVFYAMKLTNARIVSVKQYSQDGRFYEDVGFAFQKIEVEHKLGKTKGEDEWGK